MLRDRNEDTICALSTPAGQGGLAVIRVSGSKAAEVASKIIPKLAKVKLESHRIYFGGLYDQNKNKIDEVVASFFAHGKSFTGEEVVEISCHGSTYITQKVLDLLVQSGCRLADRGEFTFRAFMNNRLDLVQAESVLSLIQSESEQSSRLALRQLDGHVSKVFNELESDLTWCLAHIEASIDFSTEGLDVVDNEVLVEKLKSVRTKLEMAISSYSSGRLVKDGVKVVLFGEPNVGKSSLFNVIVQDEKAIVTNIAGTTRDVIETRTQMDGYVFRLSDTAGLRETKDQVEQIGVQRTQNEASKADVLVVVLSVDQEEWTTTVAQAQKVPSRHKLFILNKSDLVSKGEAQEKEKKLQGLLSPELQEHTMAVSCLDYQTREKVLRKAQELVSFSDFTTEAILSSARQFESAQYSLEMLSQSIADLEKGMGSEFVAMNLKESLVNLQKILGRVYDDQILDRVFKEFCLGK